MNEPNQRGARLQLIGWASLAGIPVLVLAAYAIHGLRAERKAIIADAHENGQAMAVRAGEQLSRALYSGLDKAPITRLYPPLPGPVNPSKFTQEWEEIREKGEPETLRQWREETPSEALSTTGIPLRVLAAWELVSKLNLPTDRERLRQLALQEAPSMLTPTLLRKASIDHWEPGWRRDEKVRAFLSGEENRLIEGPFTLVGKDGALGLAQSEHEAAWRVLLPGELTAILNNHTTTANLPSWMRLQVFHGGQPIATIGADSKDSSEPALPLGSHRDLLEVRTFVVDQEALMAPWRRQRNWTLTTVALVTLSAVVGLGLTISGWRRERRLHYLKSQFVASVSHELRAPVASMRLMAEALDSESVADADKKKRFFRLLAHEGARLSSMVENILDVARIEEGRKSYHFAETDVTAVVHDAVDLLEPQAESKQIQLRTQLSSIEPPPHLDALAVQQALINLLDNAVKFSPRGSRITISLLPSKSNGSWALSVCDEGPGIPNRDHQRIFHRFTRLEDELRRETQGAGIGLSLVRHVVEGHGGDITVENNPQKGCTFTLWFPNHPPSGETHG